MPERMIEAGQAIATHNHVGTCTPPGMGGQGMGAGWANAVSVGSHTAGTPHGPTGIALAGIIEGAKNNIAVINTGCIMDMYW
jgi:hypothetical protein